MSLLILSVDDNSSDQKLISIAFRSLHSKTEVQFLGNGDEAISYLKKSEPYAEAKRPDLILLDLNLPKISGSEVIAQIREDEQLSDIPVILFTGAKSNSEIEGVCDQDRTFHVVKPTGIDRFVAAIGVIDDFARDVAGRPQKRKELARKLNELRAA